MTLTQTRNELQLALLDLSQALNRESAAGFDVVFPELDSLTIETLHRTAGSVDAVYAYAAENRPHIKAERLRLGSSEHAVDIARSALYPSPRSRAATAREFTAPTTRNSGPRFATTAANTWGCRSAFRSSTAAPRATTSARRRSPPHQQLADGRRTGPAQGRSSRRCIRRRRLRQIPLGGRRAGFGRGGFPLRGAEGRGGPLDRLRFQRRQDAHGEGCLRSRAGQIRVRLPRQDRTDYRGEPLVALNSGVRTRLRRPNGTAAEGAEEASRRRSGPLHHLSPTAAAFLRPCFRRIAARPGAPR